MCTYMEKQLSILLNETQHVLSHELKNKQGMVSTA